MIITVDPINRKVLLTSIPRDYYVNLPSFGDDAYDKLTHAGYYGIEESVKAIEKFYLILILTIMLRLISLLSKVLLMQLKVLMCILIIALMNVLMAYIILIRE